MNSATSVILNNTKENNISIKLAIQPETNCDYVVGSGSEYGYMDVNIDIDIDIDKSTVVFICFYCPQLRLLWEEVKDYRLVPCDLHTCQYPVMDGFALTLIL